MKNLIISIFKIITQDIILLIFIIVTLFAPYLESDYVDRVIFFDVGQGDSILIISSKGKKILIDTGPGDYVVQKLGKYLKSDDMYLDYVVITHPHSDHTKDARYI
jgi:competence protein ComEC